MIPALLPPAVLPSACTIRLGWGTVSEPEQRDTAGSTIQVMPQNPAGLIAGIVLIAASLVIGIAQVTSDGTDCGSPISPASGYEADIAHCDDPILQRQILAGLALASGALLTYRALSDEDYTEAHGDE